MRELFSTEARYDEEERGRFYTSLTFIGRVLTEHGINVIFDATANRRAYRDDARQQIPLFVEVYVDTPLEVCMARDPKGIYRKGMKIPYEVPLAPELTLQGDHGTPAQSAAAVIAWAEGRGWISAAR